MLQNYIQVYRTFIKLVQGECPYSHPLFVCASGRGETLAVHFYYVCVIRKNLFGTKRQNDILDGGERQFAPYTLFLLREVLANRKYIAYDIVDGQGEFVFKGSHDPSCF